MKIVSAALHAADCGDITLLGLLDLSAAFDTVDHAILIERLHISFGVHGSYYLPGLIHLSEIERLFIIGQRSSRSAQDFVVPQGSVLGPILFHLYITDVTAIAERHRIGAHSYAGDIQLYAHFKPLSNHAWSAHMASALKK